jgi:hypothetical protein
MARLLVVDCIRPVALMVVPLHRVITTAVEITVVKTQFEQEPGGVWEDCATPIGRKLYGFVFLKKG